MLIISYLFCYADIVVYTHKQILRYYYTVHIIFWTIPFFKLFVTLNIYTEYQGLLVVTNSHALNMKIRLVSNNRMRQAEAQANLRQERSIKDMKKKAKTTNRHKENQLVGETEEYVLNQGIVSQTMNGSTHHIRSQSPFATTSGFDYSSNDRSTLQHHNHSALGIDPSAYR